MSRKQEIIDFGVKGLDKKFRKILGTEKYGLLRKRDTEMFAQGILEIYKIAIYPDINIYNINDSIVQLRKLSEISTQLLYNINSCIFTPISFILVGAFSLFTSSHFKNSASGVNLINGILTVIQNFYYDIFISDNEGQCDKYDVDSIIPKISDHSSFVRKLHDLTGDAISTHMIERLFKTMTENPGSCNDYIRILIGGNMIYPQIYGIVGDSRIICMYCMISYIKYCNTTKMEIDEAEIDIIRTTIIKFMSDILKY